MRRLRLSDLIGKIRKWAGCDAQRVAVSLVKITTVFVQPSSSGE
ncbi:MAG: hypothetical protein OXI84_00320 [bacterium]|nr:hypothetical protein [bacterium]